MNRPDETQHNNLVTLMVLYPCELLLSRRSEAVMAERSSTNEVRSKS